MDNSKNNAQNQTESEAPIPLYETVVEQPTGSAPEAPSQIGLQTPSIDSTPEFVVEEAPQEMVIGDDQQFVPVVEKSGGDGRMKYIMIAAAVLFFILIFGLLLWFLLGRGGKSSGPVKLIYWSLWESDAVMKPLIDEYQAKNPNVTIEYQRINAQDDYLKKIQVREGRGPDIFRFHNTWVPQLGNVLAPMPSSIMSADEFDKTFYPIHSKDLKVGNAYYGMPLMTDGLVLVYNDDIFKKAGKSAPPTTWVDVRDYMSEITVPGRNPDEVLLSTIALGTSTNIEHYSDIFGLFLLLNGADIKNLSSAEAVGALQEYRKFAEAPTATWNETMPNSINAFVQEKVAMIIVPSWQISNIRAQNPALKIKVAPIPILPGRDTNLSVSTYWVEGVSKHSKFQNEAWEFLKYMSSAETMQKMYELQSKERFIGAVSSRRDVASKLSDNTYLGPVVSQAQNDAYQTIYMVSRTYDGGMNDEIASYIGQAIDQAIGGVAYESAMNTAQSGVSEVLKQYNVK